MLRTVRRRSTVTLSLGMALGILAPIGASGALVPPSHLLFDGDAVHEIHLTFSQPDWWAQLVANFEGLDDPLYLEAAFDWEAVHFDSIGVRFKGNSSYYSYPGVKKSFKLDIDEYVAGQEIYGLDKLNLNNCFMDPSFVRERCCYELCQAVGLPTERTNFAALYINGTYWGDFTSWSSSLTRSSSRAGSELRKRATSGKGNPMVRWSIWAHPKRCTTAITN